VVPTLLQSVGRYFTSTVKAVYFAALQARSSVG
jgi:hypothetical protein